MSDLIIDLLQDVMNQHSHPDSADYNECDKEPCQWCTEAAEEIAKLRTQQGEALPYGWITENGLFTKVPVKVFVESGRWKPLYEHPPAYSSTVRVPELNNIRFIDRSSDFSVKVNFTSCRAASAFEKALKAAQGEG